MRGTTASLGDEPRDGKISIHVPREGDDAIFCDDCGEQIVISIHVPREGDDASAAVEAAKLGISIHVPREGDDQAQGAIEALGTRFQSTSPVRGTTDAKFSNGLRFPNFNPRPP